MLVTWVNLSKSSSSLFICPYPFPPFLFQSRPADLLHDHSDRPISSLPGSYHLFYTPIECSLFRSCKAYLRRGAYVDIMFHTQPSEASSMIMGRSEVIFISMMLNNDHSIPGCYLSMVVQVYPSPMYPAF